MQVAKKISLLHACLCSVAAFALSATNVVAQGNSEHEQQQIEQMFLPFMKKSGITEMPELRILLANPYTLQGKTIAVLAVFSRMLSQDSAEFHAMTPSKVPFLISKVPSTRFTQPGQEFALAVKVIGIKEATLFGVQDRFLSFEFVDALNCSKALCTSMRVQMGY